MLFLLKYWKYFAVLGVAFVVFGFGYKVAGWQCEASRLEALKAQQLQFNKQLHNKDMAAAALESKLADLEKNPRTVVKYRRVEYAKPIYVGCVMPDTGLLPINENVERINRIRAR